MSWSHRPVAKNTEVDAVGVYSAQSSYINFTSLGKSCGDAESPGSVPVRVGIVTMSSLVGMSVPASPAIPLLRSAKKTVLDVPSVKSFCLSPLPIVNAPFPWLTSLMLRYGKFEVVVVFTAPPYGVEPPKLYR